MDGKTDGWADEWIGRWIDSGLEGEGYGWDGWIYFLHTDLSYKMSISVLGASVLCK